MTVARLNHWYDSLPEAWRFQVVLWPLILLGAINMALTVSAGFPFGLLVVIALLALGLIRVPYMVGWVERAPAKAPADPRISIAAVPWVYDLNLWYDALPETRQPWVIPAALVIAGALNMLLTIHAGFPFGLLFLLALLAIVAIRAPYEAGWLIPPTAPPAQIAPAPPPEQIAHETMMLTAPMAFADPAPAIALEPMPAAAPPAFAEHQLVLDESPASAPEPALPPPVFHAAPPEPDKPA